MWFSLSFNCPFFFFLSASPMNPAKRSFDWPSANSKAASLDPNTRYLTISLSLVHHHHHRSRFILVIRSIIIYRLEGHLGTAASLRTRCSLRALTTSPCYCFNSYLTHSLPFESRAAQKHTICVSWQTTNDQGPSSSGAISLAYPYRRRLVILIICVRHCRFGTCSLMCKSQLACALREWERTSSPIPNARPKYIIYYILTQIRFTHMGCSK